MGKLERQEKKEEGRSGRAKRDVNHRRTKEWVQNHASSIGRERREAVDGVGSDNDDHERDERAGRRAEERRNKGRKQNTGINRRKINEVQGESTDGQLEELLDTLRTSSERHSLPKRNLELLTGK